MVHRLLGRAVAALVLTAALQWLGRTYGSTADERARTLPGDELVTSPHVVTDHATTIRARPEAVWPWLVQMGWGRGGWYTARWVDRLIFPRNGPSADVIHPELQGLALGDTVLDGPPEANCRFTVTALQPNRHLVLFSREHLPPGWAEHGAGIGFSWAFVLTELGGGRTRFHFRCRARLRPWWAQAVYVLTMVPADLVMSRQMMRGLRARVEATSHTAG